MPQFTAGELRRYSTLAEKKMWDYLKARSLMGLKFRRQHQIDRTIVDFVCLKERLVIELDGSVHERRIHYDQKRDAWLRNQGYRVLRFKNDEFENQPEKVIEKIKAVIRYIVKNRVEKAPPLAPPHPSDEEGN